MSDEIKLVVPAPFGAGIILGLIKVVPRREQVFHRGPVSIWQANSRPASFRSAQNRLIGMAKRKGISVKDFPYTLLLERGFMGTVRVVDCHDLSHPASPYKWADHLNLGDPGPVPQWGWIVQDPVLAVRQDPKSALALAHAFRHDQQALNLS